MVRRRDLGPWRGSIPVLLVTESYVTRYQRSDSAPRMRLSSHQRHEIWMGMFGKGEMEFEI